MKSYLDNASQSQLRDAAHSRQVGLETALEAIIGAVDSLRREYAHLRKIDDSTTPGEAATAVRCAARMLREVAKSAASGLESAGWAESAWEAVANAKHAETLANPEE